MIINSDFYCNFNFHLSLPLNIINPIEKNTMRKNVFLLIWLFVLCLPLNMKADCTLDNTSNLNGTTPRPVGINYRQSFLACETGTINSILLNYQFNLNPVGPLDFYMVAGDGNGTINAASPYQTFAVGAGGMFTFNFSTPFPVTAGNLYSFALRGADVTADGSPMPAIDPNVPDGQSSFLISSGVMPMYSPMAAQDLYFLISNKGPVVEPIPTMSQWGLLIFGLLVLNMGVFFVQRKALVL